MQPPVKLHSCYTRKSNQTIGTGHTRYFVLYIVRTPVRRIRLLFAVPHPSQAENMKADPDTCSVSQNGAGRKGQAEKEKQRRAGREGQAEEDRQNKTGRTGQAEQDRIYINIYISD
jgi:hypothetical protein